MMEERWLQNVRAPSGLCSPTTAALTVEAHAIILTDFYRNISGAWLLLVFQWFCQEKIKI